MKLLFYYFTITCWNTTTPTSAGEFVNGSVALRIDEYTVGLHNLTITASDQFQNIASEVYNFTTLPGTYS